MKTKAILFLSVLFAIFTACNNDTKNEEADNHTMGNGNDEMHMNDDAQAMGNHPEIQQSLYNYYEIKNALVKSNADVASKAAETMKASLPKFKSSAGEHATHMENNFSEMDNALQIISSSKDLEVQRNNFQVVSDHLYQMIKMMGPTGETVYRQYCSMAFDNKGAYWLSSQKEIRNPYFGDAMMKCGSVKETLN